MVIDADALKVFSSVVHVDHPAIIATPHIGEFAGMSGLDVKEIISDKEGAAKKYAMEKGVILVLKGFQTIIATPDGVVLKNTKGNAGMATAGVGDVLTGIISVFLAQGCLPVIAAGVGVFLHSLAGDMAAEDIGKVGMIAGDILDRLPRARKSVEENK